MNTIASRKWHAFGIQQQIAYIANRLLSKDFIETIGFPVSFVPGMALYLALRNLQIATLEVLEIYDTATIYRIRQTGQVYLTIENHKETIFNDYQDFLNQDPVDGKLLVKLPAEELVYTYRYMPYQITIKRHKFPKFTGVIEITTNQVLDGSPQKHIDITQISWIDEPPKTAQQINSVLKKTILFVRNNVYQALPDKK